MISISESLSKIFFICTLYFNTCWNIIIVLLFSSNFTSIPCIDPGVWNLGVWPLELVPYELRFLCAIQTFPNTFMLVVKLGFEGSITSFFGGDGTNCCTFCGSPSKSYIYSSANYWAWDFGSFLGHLWCSCPYNLYSCLKEIGSHILNLRHMDFSFYFWLYYCCFLNNFVLY